MTATRPTSSSGTRPSASPPGRVSAWLQTHKQQAAAGAAGVAVAGFALYRRHAAAAAAGTGAAPTDSSGLAGYGTSTVGQTPDTSGTDYGNQFQDALNQLQGEIDNLGATPATPTAPKPAPKPVTRKAPAPSPVPKPGTGTYKIRHGDTLAKIAQRLFGSSDPWALHDLRKSNPIFRTFDRTDSLNHYAGHTLKIPKATPPPTKKKPQSAKHAAPKKHEPPKKRRTPIRRKK